METFIEVGVTVKIFDDPEYCCEYPIRGSEMCLYLRHGHCMLFGSDSYSFFDPLSDFQNVMTTEKSDKYKKCQQCKSAYKKALLKQGGENINLDEIINNAGALE